MVCRKLHLSNTSSAPCQDKMNISKAIQRGDLVALRANEHEIVQDVNDTLKESSIVWENYITYWMASHHDHEVATEMFKVFLNTCKTAFKPDKYEEVIGLYAHPTMIGAVATKNLEILDFLKGYIDESDVEEEMIALHGETFS
jgi:hypothetical protein